MASYTKNLNLLKKYPVADGADTFNIETMLNENWDKIDEKVATGKAMKDHVTNQENPHKVTAEQVGAASSVHSHTIDQVEGLNTALSNKADKVEPERYDFPFADGFQAYQPCKYWKNEFGEVTIQIGAMQNDVIITAGFSGSVIGNIPEGFRPKQQIYFPATTALSNCVGFINPAGSVAISTKDDIAPGNRYTAFTISYIAN